MRVHHLSHTEIDPQLWDAFIEASPQGSLYATHAYASNVAPGWKAIILEDNGTWKAVLPYYPSKKYGLKYALQPAFCQSWGPMLSIDSKGTYDQFSQSHALLEALAEALPAFHFTQIQCHPSLQYLLPFHQHGFTISTRYTHQLQLGDEQNLRTALSKQAKRKLKKSEKAGHVFEQANNAKPLLKLIEANAKAGHDTMGGLKGGVDLLGKIVQLPAIEIAQLSSDTISNAAGAFAHWNGTAYYLAGAQLPGQPDEGAMYRLLWEAILNAQRKGCTIFDFEGSMIPGVARFFRQFGSTPVPYFSLTKNRLPLPLRWMHA